METVTNNANQLDRLLKLREVAEIIARSERELWREIRRGRLAHPVPGRPARVFQSDVRNYLQRLREERDNESAQENGVPK
jgi:predicted DNA-binding transcriptional regulator AlpA